MKRILITACLLLLSACSLPKVASSFFAKEVCSCLFVSQQNEDYCVDYGQPTTAMSSYSIDYETKTVEARKVLSSSKAQYTSVRYGCNLVK